MHILPPYAQLVPSTSADSQKVILFFKRTVCKKNGRCSINSFLKTWRDANFCFHILSQHQINVNFSFSLRSVDLWIRVSYLNVVSVKPFEIFQCRKLHRTSCSSSRASWFTALRTVSGMLSLLPCTADCWSWHALQTGHVPLFCDSDLSTKSRLDSLNPRPISNFIPVWS